MSKKINKFLIIPNNKVIKNYNFNFFILPLKNYSIGFDVYFNINEINKLALKYDIYIIINKFLHKEELNRIDTIIKKLKNIKGYFIEDLGLIDIIGNNKCILNQNHILSNYKAINFLFNKNIKNVVVSNELTYDELDEIRKKTKAKLYYFFINKNIIMYSERKLITNYYKNYKLHTKNKSLILDNCNKKLILKEENNQSVLFNYETFCASKYLNILKKYDYLIVNLSNINKEESKLILENINDNNLYKIINCDYYFLENEIKYKVKDI